MAARIAEGDSPTASLQQISRRGEPAIRGLAGGRDASLAAACSVSCTGKTRADDRLEAKRHREGDADAGKAVITMRSEIIAATFAAFLALTTSSHATLRDEDQFRDAWGAKTKQLEKDVKASNPDVVEIRLAGSTLIMGTKEPVPTENDWQAMATARDKADAWPHYAEAACHSTQLRTYMSKGFSVVFRLYDMTGNLRVTYAPVNIGACRNI
jgi:hypothetical protein